MKDARKRLKKSALCVKARVVDRKTNMGTLRRCGVQVTSMESSCVNVCAWIWQCNAFALPYAAGVQGDMQPGCWPARQNTASTLRRDTRASSLLLYALDGLPCSQHVNEQHGKLRTSAAVDF